MWELDHEEGWAPKNWCSWTVVLEKTLESRLDSKEIKPVSPKGNQSWIVIGRTDAEAEAPVLWPLDARGQLIGKRPWCWERLRAGEEGEDRGWDGWMASLNGLNGHVFEQTPGDSEGLGSLLCCSLWGHKESDTTEQLNNNNSSVQSLSHVQLFVTQWTIAHQAPSSMEFSRQ